MKKVFKLGYIHCAGCSVALQDKISKVEGVNDAQINFVTKLVTVDIENKNSKHIMQQVYEAVHEFDKSIEILSPGAKEKIKKSDIVGYYLLGASIVLWILGISLEYSLNLLYVHLPIYIVSYLLIGWRVLANAIKNLVKGKMLDETFLMSIATIGAFIIGEYLEGSAVMIFYTIGEIFNRFASAKSENRIKSLASIKSTVANLVNDNGDIMVVELESINVGDKICVNAGEKVPLDGKIISGGANFNTSTITGESVGRYYKVGDEVLSGFIAEDSSVIVEVLTKESDSTVSKIVKMVEEASASKAHAEKFISKFAKVYTPIVVALALAICFIMPAFWGYTLQAFKLWAYRGLSFLVVSCPCALVLSVPLTFFAGIGASAKSGVLVKGSNYLEILAKVKSVCFDKTGTLTSGNFGVTNIVSVGEKTEDDILELISYGESFSNHRIAKSIVEHYRNKTKKTINTAWVNNYKEIAGGGVSANIFMQDCLIGSKEFLQENGIQVPDINPHETVCYLACQDTLEGYVCVSDTLKNDSKYAITLLKKQGLKTYMLTGDNNDVASHVSSVVGLDGYFSGLKPEQKVQQLNNLLKTGKVAFVGDGINDAPVLTTASVGIAMGGVGSDIAIESADVVIMTDEPSKVVDAIKVSKNTQKIVIENIIFTIGIKLLTLLLVSFGLAGMWLAVFADVGVSVLAVLNSLRAMKRYDVSKLKDKKVDK